MRDAAVTELFIIYFRFPEPTHVSGLPGISGIGIGAGVSGVGALGSGNAAQVVQALIELPSNLLDSNYHKDFTDIVDRTAFNRGGTPYIRPCGWYRFALKVNGKYKDNIL